MAADAITINLERSVLGRFLLLGHLPVEAGALTPDDFVVSAHQKIFRRTLDLDGDGRSIDALSLAQELGAELESVGGIAYLNALTDFDVACLPPLLPGHIRLIRENARARKAGKIGEALAARKIDPSSATSELEALGCEPSDSAPRQSEEFLALQFTRRHGDDLRYVAAWGTWLCYKNNVWVRDTTLDVYDRAREIAREAASQCGENEKSLACRLASAQTNAAIERLARQDRKHAATVDQWDSDPWLLNTPGGIVDLRAGELRPANREAYCTKMTGATPGGECPLWMNFGDRVTGGDVEQWKYMQRVVGYALTGSTRDHGLFFHYGCGANGKSVYLSTLMAAFGSYAKTAPIETFIASKTESHPTDLAGLQGARLVTAVETEEGRKWAESKIKTLTGGDRISARFMRQDFFEYTPQFKLLIAGNHKPGLRTVDEAMRRRFHLIPFTVTIPERERDPELTEKLKAELGGILRWAIEGCLEWQRQGLNPPAAVRSATEDYLAAEDNLARWMDDCCVVNKSCWTSAKALFADWSSWCETNNEPAGSQKKFSQNLESRGFAPERTRAARGFLGIGLVTDATDSPVIPVTRAHAYTPIRDQRVTCVTDSRAEVEQ